MVSVPRFCPRRGGIYGEVLAVDEAVERPMGEEARELSFRIRAEAVKRGSVSRMRVKSSSVRRSEGGKAS